MLESLAAVIHHHCPDDAYDKHIWPSVLRCKANLYAPLTIVHQPFAKRARTLENAFHANVAASDALYVSRPRAAQETQGSESGESGDDEGLHEGL